MVPAAARIRNTLNFQVADRSGMSTWTDALRHFVEQAEKAGVMVMRSGIVKNNTRRPLDPNEFRGFALVDGLAPLVFINGKDTKAAQMFTLAHELAHIWLGEPGVSDIQAVTHTDQVVERWCNKVAAELLVPLEEMKREFCTSALLNDEVSRLARVFKVSTLVILRRVHDAGRLTREQFWQVYSQELSKLKTTSKGSGGSFYPTQTARVGKRFARAVVISTWEGRSSFTEAFRLLGCKKMETFRNFGDSLEVRI